MNLNIFLSFIPRKTRINYTKKLTSINMNWQLYRVVTHKKLQPLPRSINKSWSNVKMKGNDLLKDVKNWRSDCLTKKNQVCGLSNNNDIIILYCTVIPWLLGLPFLASEFCKYKFVILILMIHCKTFFLQIMWWNSNVNWICFSSNRNLYAFCADTSH